MLCRRSYMPGFTHSMHVHDSIVSEGERLMGYLLDKPQCQAYLLHVHTLWKVRLQDCWGACGLDSIGDQRSLMNLKLLLVGDPSQFRTPN